MTVTQNYGNIISSTPILSADPNVKEDVMTDQQKITILYCRLSNEDSQDRESNSIQNQREFLTRYARDHGYTNLKVLVDDGYTGTNFQRPGVQEGFELVKQGLVGCWLCKDLSRFGRDYLTVGQYTDIIFPSYDVRFIAINDGVDSQRGDGEGFAAIRNLFNEWYPRDTSKKVRTSLRQRGTSGKHLGKPPYGYRCDPNDKDKWILDEDAAPIVKRIFDLCIDGKGPEQISRILERDQVLTTKALYASRKGKPLPKNPYGWSDQSIVGILERQEYTGCTCNFKTYSKSYKLKKRIPNEPENMFIVPDTQEAIVSQAQWDRVQELRKNKRRPTATGKTSLFSGLVFCADCGSKLHFCAAKSLKANQEFFRCANYKSGRGECTIHYIRNVVLEQIVSVAVSDLADFVTCHESFFLQMIGKRQSAGKDRNIRSVKSDIVAGKHRIDEIDRLIAKLYEDNFAGKLSDERYSRMAAKYEKEQAELLQSVSTKEKELAELERESVDIRLLLAGLREYSSMETLTPEVVNKIIKRIEVHNSETVNGHKRVGVDIYFTGVGLVDLATIKEMLAIAESSRP